MASFLKVAVLPVSTAHNSDMTSFSLVKGQP